MKLNLTVLSKTILKLPKLFLGFILSSFGITLMLTAGTGVNPWGTFTSGLVNITGMSFGNLSQLIGLTIILITLPLKIFPGIGTVLNMIFIGLFIDFFKSSGLLVQPNHLTLQLLMCILGLITLSFGIYVYISCGLGAGPRDGLMLALIKISGKSITVIKTLLEISVVIIGISLGGVMGVGTVLIALLGGKFLNFTFTKLNFDPMAIKHQNLSDFFKSTEVHN